MTLTLPGAVVLGLAVLGAACGPGGVYATVVDGTLTISGSPAGDVITLRLQPGDPDILQIDEGDDGRAELTFDRDTFTRIHLQGGAGDDRIRIDRANGPFTDETITIDGGAGHDVVAGADGSDVRTDSVSRAASAPAPPAATR